jgi:hypothetical protein
MTIGTDNIAAALAARGNAMTLGLPTWIGKPSRSAAIVLGTLGVCFDSSDLLAQSNQVSNSLLLGHARGGLWTLRQAADTHYFGFME